jgi:hypothetical protein
MDTIEITDKGRAEYDALVRDAKRYRWLRDPPARYPLEAWIAAPGDEHVSEEWLIGKAADAAIDAAMGASRATPEPPK